MKNFANLTTLILALAFAMGTTACTKSKGKSQKASTKAKCMDKASTKCRAEAGAKCDAKAEAYCEAKAKAEAEADARLKAEAEAKVQAEADARRRAAKCPDGCVKAPTPVVKPEPSQPRQPRRRYYKPRRTRRPTTVASRGDQVGDNTRRIVVLEGTVKNHGMRISKLETRMDGAEEAIEVNNAFRKRVQAEGQ